MALTQDEVIEQFKKTHGNKYNYSKVVYIKSNHKVEIICPEHGSFFQTPNNHKNGQGCIICSGKTKQTEEEILRRLNMIHNKDELKYSYNIPSYKNINQKIKITCLMYSEHGVFEQTISNHLNGQGCPKCELVRRKINPNGKKTQKETLEDFKKIHGNKYDYSKVEYKNNNIKIEIICPEHGSFFQTSNAHKNGSGCPKCGGKEKLTIIQVIEKAHLKHNINSKPKYIYNIKDYKSIYDRIDILCPSHGIFNQSIIGHLSGNGCPKCGNEIVSKIRRLPQSITIKRFKEIHGDKYNYSKVNYSTTMNKVEIICPEHGSFFQKPNDHKNGVGCPECDLTKKLSKEETILHFKKTHQDKYDYSLVDYTNTKEKVQIICPEHGSFFQKPNNHKQGQGCPQCKSNKKEEFLTNLFKEYNINYIYNDRTIIAPLEIDIFIPDFKFGIEHNGLYFHSYGKNSWSALNNYHLLNKNRHLEKTIKMEEQDYQLFHIREDHLLCPLKKDIWKSVLLNKCGFSNKVHARKLQVVNLNGHQDFVKTFLEDNHLQGSCPASIKLGLQDPETGIIYSIMTFGKSRFDKNIEYELLRFCNLRYHNVRGAASKLMSGFEKYYKPDSIISYANRDWSQGNLYRAIGFKYSHIAEPNYFYIDCNFNIIKRQQAQKHKLKAFLESKNLVFNENLSERDNMINNGYRIYYDTGNLVYHKIY